jgi:hypothetical protein
VLSQARTTLRSCDKPFGVLVDIRTLKPLVILASAIPVRRT